MELVTELVLEIVEVRFKKGLTSQDQAISEVANAAPKGFVSDAG